MTIQEFVNIDKKIDEGMFMTKVHNIFIQLLSSNMLDELEDVKHFLGEDVYNYANDIIKKNKEDNTRQMYDELNVKSSYIESVEVKENVYTIKVYLQSRYMNYIINLSDGSYLSGNNSSRIQVDYRLTFDKKINTIEQGIARKCPGCSAPINVNESGKCDYCGAIYNQEDYDWVLTKLEVLN
jgi:hypothetical protein